jgi:hypothetical protein
MPKLLSVSLSPEAFAHLKEVVTDEFGLGHTDQEIEEMGLRLLRLFDLVTPKGNEVSKPQLSNEETKAITYINACVTQHKHPTVRGVAEAIGKQSSRSGMRMVDTLQKRGLVIRDEEGRINLTDQGSSFAA